MGSIRKYFEGIFSIDWSKRLANIYGFACAILVYIAWPLIPFPALHCVVHGVDLAGTLLTASACVAAVAFMLGRGGWKAAGSLSNYLTYALLVATVLILVSIVFSIRTIVVQGGISLDIVLLFVGLAAFMGAVGVRSFWELFLRMFFLLGIPLLFVDLYFGFAIFVSFHIPYDSLILGGGGLNDGLNKMFFMILAFVLAYHLLTTRYGERMDAIGAKYLGPEGGDAGATAQPAGDDAPGTPGGEEGGSADPPPV